MAQRARYNALPEEQRAALERVFSLYDADESGQLDVTEMRQALLDLGLRGINAEEQRRGSPIETYTCKRMAPRWHKKKTKTRALKKNKKKTFEKCQKLNHCFLDFLAN